MPLTPFDVDQFHSFATRSVAERMVDSFDELYLLWQSERERSDVNDQINSGLSDIAAGRVQPADDVNDELAAEFELDNE